METKPIARNARLIHWKLVDASWSFVAILYRRRRPVDV
jgi:hypothetical protein